MIDGLARYCYDCPIVQNTGFYPLIVKDTPYGFQCKACSFINKQNFPLGDSTELVYPELYIKCLSICNVSPNFKYDPQTFSCVSCFSATDDYYSSDELDCVSEAECKSSLPALSQYRGKNTDIKYCGLCSNSLLIATVSCRT